MTHHQTSNRRHPTLRAASRLCAFIAAAIGTTLIAAEADSQEGAYVEETEEVTATVTAIEPETRMLTLRSEDGVERVIEAGEKVRNFEQIEIGDQVEVLFYEALAAEVTEAPPTAETGGAPVVIDSRRAPLGEKPEGAVSMVYTAVVTIDAVDPDENTVQFTGPDGQPREVHAKRPEMQEFIKSLNPGDRVQVTYGEALAVAVRPSETETEPAE